MKRYFLIVIAVLAGLLTVSCKKTTEGVTGITYYPIINLDGDLSVFLKVGESYVEPGFTALEGSNDVTDNVIIEYADAAGEEVEGIDTSSPGLFTVYYSAINVDGYSATVSRDVFVYDPAVTNSIEGSYDVDMEASTFKNSNGTYTMADRLSFYGGEAPTGIQFKELVPGIFSAEDLLCHWYYQLRARFNANQKMSGVVLLNADNTLTLLASYIPQWGDGLDYFKNGVYDPSTGDLSFVVSYAGSMVFTWKLHKN